MRDSTGGRGAVRDELVLIEQNLKTNPLGFLATVTARISFTIDGQAVRPASHRLVHIGASWCAWTAP